MIATVSPTMQLLAEWADMLVPDEPVRTWDWVCQHGRTEEGLTFDPDMIPYVEGVFDAWDDPMTREVVLKWGTRLGKSMTGLQLILKIAATDPATGLFGTSTQDLSRRIVKQRIYKALRACSQTEHLLPSEAAEAADLIKLSNSPWYVAWSGSATQLADLSAVYGWANEIDKWTFNETMGGEAGEGDPLDQYMERFKEHWDYKVLFECSPSTKAKSRIEKKYQASDKRQLNVPCKHCGRYQVLILGLDEYKEGKKGGLRWERDSKGNSDPATASRTAYYECAHCGGRIDDKDRRPMIKAGVWTPEGCFVDDGGKLRGTPLRDQRIAGFHLPSFYSLQMPWGRIASEWLNKAKSPASRRMFINGWQAEAWEPYRSKTEPEQVGERLASKTPRCIVPKWATWLFAGVDQQEDSFPWVVVACGPNDMEQPILHGSAATEEELDGAVFKREFAHEDGGSLTVALSLADSGFRTYAVYRMCKRLKKDGILVLPCKGANTDLGGESHSVVEVDDVKYKTARAKRAALKAGRGLRRVRVNPYYYEPIISEQVDILNPGEPGSLSLCIEDASDVEFLRDLCNGAQSANPSKQDPDKHLWVKRWEREPNDKRDCLKYATCARDIFFRRYDWLKQSKGKTIDRRDGVAAVATGSVIRESQEPTAKHRSRERFRPKFSRRGSSGD